MVFIYYFFFALTENLFLKFPILDPDIFRFLVSIDVPSEILLACLICHLTTTRSSVCLHTQAHFLSNCEFVFLFVCNTAESRTVGLGGLGVFPSLHHEVPRQGAQNGPGAEKTLAQKDGARGSQCPRGLPY